MFEYLPNWVNIALNWLGAIILWTAGVFVIVLICGIIIYGVREFIMNDDDEE